MPAPVKVTVEPEMVAGPDTTEYEITPDEVEVADTVNGASPYVWFGAKKLIVGAARDTVTEADPDALL